MQKRVDSIAAVLFLIFSGFAWDQIRRLPGQGAANEDLGTHFFPAVCVCAIGLLALLLLWRALRGRSVSYARLQGGALRCLALGSVAMLGYVLGYEWAGFYISTFLFSVAFLLITGERRPLMLLGFPLGMNLLVYVCFEQILLVTLPVGEVVYMLFP